MSDQPSLFGETAPYQPHSKTSKEAAVEIEPSLNDLQLKVLRCIEDRGAFGATDEEVQHMLRMNPSTQRPRRIELELKGLIRAGHTKRKTRSGRNATVWVAA